MAPLFTGLKLGFGRSAEVAASFDLFVQYLVIAAGGGGGNDQNGAGGGGGAGYNTVSNGGDGGPGIVILRYPNAFTIANPGGGLTYSTSPVGGDKVTSFTVGTGNISFT